MPHNVKSVETVWVDLPMREIPARNMIRENPHWTIFEICKVTLDSGIVGFGETMVYYTWGANTVSEAAKAKVVGKHPAENMWDDSLGAGLQIALMDAAAKIVDAPLHQLLGKQVRDRCHISWWDIDMPAEDWIAECQLAIENGYNSFKTKGRPWFDIIEQTRQLCATLPVHFEVDMDFNSFGVDTAHCTRLLKELEQFHHIVMYETPIPHKDVGGYKFLRQHTHVPISMHTQMLRANRRWRSASAKKWSKGLSSAVVHRKCSAMRWSARRSISRSSCRSSGRKSRRRLHCISERCSKTRGGRA